MTAMSNAQIIWDKLTAAGLTAAGAAGLLGNLDAESGLNPQNLQNSYEKKLGYTDADYTAAVDCGAYANFSYDGAGYGLAQWTYWSRKRNLLAYAKSKGKSVGDLEMQLEFLRMELTVYGVLSVLKTSTSVREASDCVLLQFERPKDQSQSNLDRRFARAQEFYNKFAGGMTMSNGMTPQKRVISTAKAQEGYLGKKTNAQLDDFTANSGGLFNRFARDLDAMGDFYNGRKNGFDWCDVFVDWCFVTTFGRELAQKLLCQPNKSLGAGTKYSMDYYKARGRFFQTPQPGDQIFFGTATVTSHTGLVVAVDDGYVYTTEGNAGNPSAVRACRYSLRYAKIKGYGRPDWSLAPEKNKEDKTVSYEQWKEYMDRYRKELRADHDKCWAEEELDAAVAAGITDGRRPHDLVTREEAAIMALRSGQGKLD